MLIKRNETMSFRFFPQIQTNNPMRLITHKFTEMSNYLVDWSRAAELFLSNHRYSNKELLIRGAVAGFGALCGLLTYLTNDPTKTGISTTAFTLLNTFLGTLIAHSVVVYPLYEKRVEIQNSCNELILMVRDHAFPND